MLIYWPLPFPAIKSECNDPESPMRQMETKGKNILTAVFLHQGKKAWQNFMPLLSHTQNLEMRWRLWQYVLTC